MDTAKDASPHRIPKPRKPREQVRTRGVRVRLSEPETEVVVRAAREAGTTVAGLARSGLLARIMSNAASMMRRQLLSSPPTSVLEVAEALDAIAKARDADAAQAAWLAADLRKAYARMPDDRAWAPLMLGELAELAATSVLEGLASYTVAECEAGIALYEGLAVRLDSGALGAQLPDTVSDMATHVICSCARAAAAFRGALALAKLRETAAEHRAVRDLHRWDGYDVWRELAFHEKKNPSSVE